MKRKVVLCTNNLLTHATLPGPLQLAGCEVVLALSGRVALERGQ